MSVESCQNAGGVVALRPVEPEEVGLEEIDTGGDQREEVLRLRARGRRSAEVAGGRGAGRVGRWHGTSRVPYSATRREKPVEREKRLWRLNAPRFILCRHGLRLAADGEDGDVVFLAEGFGGFGEIEGRLLAEMAHAVEAEELAGRAGALQPRRRRARGSGRRDGDRDGSSS